MVTDLVWHHSAMYTYIPVSVLGDRSFLTNICMCPSVHTAKECFLHLCEVCHCWSCLDVFTGACFLLFFLHKSGTVSGQRGTYNPNITHIFLEKPKHISFTVTVSLFHDNSRVKIKHQKSRREYYSNKRGMCLCVFRKWSHSRNIWIFKHCLSLTRWEHQVNSLFLNSDVMTKDPLDILTYTVYFLSFGLDFGHGFELDIFSGWESRSNGTLMTTTVRHHWVIIVVVNFTAEFLKLLKQVYCNMKCIPDMNLL